jgi:nicotinamidase-related amidase
VNALQEQGFVSRGPHPTDGRQVLITLTDAGREQLRQRHQLSQDALAGLMARRLTPAEQHALSKTVGLLQRLGEDSTPYYIHPRSSDMPATALDERSALVLIDLQKRILAMPTAHPADGVLQNATRLAEAFRAKGLPVVRVRVAWSPDGGDMPVSRTALARPTTAPPADFAEFPDELGPIGDDIVITKRHWGAFTGTELDLQLRRRGVTQIVLGGIATSIGVESTARSAHEHSYHLTVVEDATTDVDIEAHAHTFGKIFPRIAETATTDEVLALLKG